MANFYRLKLSDKGYERYLRNYHFDISEKQWKRWKQCIRNIGDTVRKYDIIHPNKKGVEIAAEAIFDYLKSNN